jgi:predicted ATPase
MLLRFEAANHRSINEPVELSMIAVDEDRSATRGFDRLSERVLTVAGIYGPNASGKTNVLGALAWLSRAVEASLRAWDRNIPREPFRFGRGPDSSSVYQVEMMIGGVRYTYHVELDDAAVRYEVLYSYPERRRRVLFEREDMEFTLRRGLGALSGVRELLTPRTLALSAAIRFDDPEVAPFGRHLAEIQPIGKGLARKSVTPFFWGDIFNKSVRSISWGQGEGQSISGMELLKEREAALGLLRFADLGIHDVRVVEDESKVPPNVIQLAHRAGQQQVLFELQDESAGTLTWLSLIEPVLYVLRSGQILLLDEIDASLHPVLSARLLKLFQDPETNPRGAQLIFTTHDTSLLNHLNRDEVWLTEKDDDGATTLTALAEYGGDKVRRSLNLERAYLHGRFGAVPELDQIKLRSALGLVSGDD